jgi:SAM-dependent methyltransferase
MGMGFANLEYLTEKRLIARKSRILDIGSQNLYNVTPERIVSFIRQFGRPLDDKALKEASERLSYFSTPRPGETTTFLADLLDLTEITYLGYDVCPSPGTEIFDLNIQRLPVERRNTFDIVFNFGTTEHVINQLNAFEVMHDAMKVGGICFHQLPSIGYVDHGYVNYNPLFIDDLVTANDYEVIDRFYTTAGGGPFGSAGVDIRDPERPSAPRSGSGPEGLPNFNLNYIVRKKVDAPFYVGLEIATTHAPLSQEATASYGERRRLAAGDIVRGQSARPESSKPSWRSRLNDMTGRR